MRLGATISAIRADGTAVAAASPRKRRASSICRASRTAPARSISMRDLQSKRSSSLAPIAQVKLAMLMFSLELQRAASPPAGA